jgi:hypothetical protein
VLAATEIRRNTRVGGRDEVPVCAALANEIERSKAVIHGWFVMGYGGVSDDKIFLIIVATADRRVVALRAI